MAYNRHSQFVLGFIINLLLSTVIYVVAVRDVPTSALKNDNKQPEFLHYDGTVFVPGFGRYMHPKKSLHYCDNPFNFNPITGTCGGSGLIVPGRGDTGSSGGARRGFVPGGDDTNVPNPGEAPIPGNGGHVPAPSHP